MMEFLICLMVSGALVLTVSMCLAAARADQYTARITSAWLQSGKEQPEMTDA
jgi:hypothetical protein